MTTADFTILTKEMQAEHPLSPGGAPSGLEVAAFSIKVADAAMRKALWALQSEMAKQADAVGRASSQGRAWGHCATNVKLWLEMDGIEPWTENGQGRAQNDQRRG